MSLEHWAEHAKGKILVVSHDNGWADFCKKSKWLVCIDDLSKALTHFQPHTVAKKVIEDLKRRAKSLILVVREGLEPSTSAL